MLEPVIMLLVHFTLIGTGIALGRTIKRWRENRR